MTETQIYADNFSCSFRDPDQFLGFLKERTENSMWMKAPSRNLQFCSVAKDSNLSSLYMQIYQNNGKAGILADTMENTSVLLCVNGSNYPVRSCAIKTILERARISGHALNKVSRDVFTQILNYCLNVATGDSLIKVADEKVSAVHGGDPKDYAVLEMLPLFERVKGYLEQEFPGSVFMAANFDHSLTTAIWRLDGQADELLDTYKTATVRSAVYIQYRGNELGVDDLPERSQAAFMAEHKRTKVEEIKVYVKPEDNAAYYVVNGTHNGKIDL